MSGAIVRKMRVKKAPDTGRRLRVLISSGPTREPIDPVRFLSNYSTGYMGSLLAVQALKRGHRVTVVSGPSVEPLPAEARTIQVEQANEMADALRRESPRADVVIMAAAVSDFQPRHRLLRKLPRHGQATLRLRRTPDLIARLPRSSRQVRVGFAVESGAMTRRARRKLEAKRLDLLVAQRIQHGHGGMGGSPFGRHPVEAWLVTPARTTRLGLVQKPHLARALLDKAEALWYGQPRLQR